MLSLVILMMEPEMPDGLSTRKLVAETAKHNVLTAYGAEDGLKLLERFPNVDVVLVHSDLLQRRADLLTQARTLAPEALHVLVSPLAQTSSTDAHFVLDSHRPHQLLELLQRQFKTGA